MLFLITPPHFFFDPNGERPSTLLYKYTSFFKEVFFKEEFLFFSFLFCVFGLTIFVKSLIQKSVMKSNINEFRLINFFLINRLVGFFVFFIFIFIVYLFFYQQDVLLLEDLNTTDTIFFLNDNFKLNYFLRFLEKFIFFLFFLFFILLFFSYQFNYNLIFFNKTFLYNWLLINFETIFIIFMNFFFCLLLIFFNNFFLFVILMQLLSITTYYLFIGTRTITCFYNIIKYFYYSSFSVICLLFSCFIFYFLFASLNLDYVSDSIFESFFYLDFFLKESNKYFFLFNSLTLYQHLILLAIILFFTSIFFKIGAAPLHVWSILVSETSSIPFLFLTMFINKIIFLFILLKFYLIFFSLNSIFFFFKYFFLFFGFSSVIYSSFLIFIINNLKTFYAYLLLQSNGIVLLFLSLVDFDFYSKSILQVFSNILLYLFTTSINWFIFFCFWLLFNYLKKFSNRENHKAFFDVKYLSEFKEFGFIFMNNIPIFFKIIFLINFLILIGFPPSNIFVIKMNLLVWIYQFWGFYYFLFLFILFILPIEKIFLIFKYLFLFDHKDQYTYNFNNSKDLEKINFNFFFLLDFNIYNPKNIGNQIFLVLLSTLPFFFFLIFIHIFSPDLQSLIFKLVLFFIENN